eukprot:scaffold174782_cov19-Tisochrysis_lutea.AAC.1
MPPPASARNFLPAALPATNFNANQLFGTCVAYKVAQTTNFYTGWTFEIALGNGWGLHPHPGFSAAAVTQFKPLSEPGHS